jgi:predicted 3-demethylubiquinone-9 3-methyltransferase (glyoxalase superfamily)
MQVNQRIAPCLWFDRQAEEAANLYVSVFANSRILRVSRYTEAGKEVHKQSPGSVMTVEFELDGQLFTALNGGPDFKFNEAVSFQVLCRNQEEIDHYWNKLSSGGDAKAQQCGWLKDKYGLSWQVIPAALPEMLKDHTSGKAQRVMEALLRMKKIDVNELERAAAREVVHK